MNVEGIESLLERSRPAPPPPELRRRILEAADRRLVSVPVPPPRPRKVEVMTMAASILMLIATVSWLLRETPPAPAAGTQESGQPFEERRLTDQLPGALEGEVSWSADGKHWACLSSVPVTGNMPMYCVIVDGKRGPEFPVVSLPRFGSDGRYAYTALDSPGHVLFLNDVPQKGFDTYQSFVWSPDGKKLAYVGLLDGKYFVVEDGRKSGPYDGVLDLLWSPDGSILAYAALVDNDWFSVENGKKGEPFDGVQNLRFAPDGKTLAYTAREGDALVVIGKVKGPDLPEVGAPVFSADGKTVSYSVTHGTESYLNVGPVPGGPFRHTQRCAEVGRPVLSADGKVVACRAKLREQDKEFVLLYREETEKKVVIMKDGQQKTLEKTIYVEKPDAMFDSVSDPVMNADGSQVAYAAGKGTRKYLVVGHQRTLKFSMIDRISFGPDGKTLAYRAGQYGKQLVVAGEGRSDEADEIVSGPVWSADGKKVAFTARTGSELWSRVLEVK
jgi:hypothetical protein